jgi:hypothetical protein
MFVWPDYPSHGDKSFLARFDYSRINSLCKKPASLAARNLYAMDDPERGGGDGRVEQRRGGAADMTTNPRD